jgi:ATP-dependent DNA ligase
MAPTLAKPFHRPGWIFEEKYDGWRLLAYKEGSVVRRMGPRLADCE